ncbi:MAG TPA: helix-turn-helix domain-containing protein, partial [Mycobacterium sp.]|nr:helix-turn-helix domain-containing protein [Mycobacterium sp.]
AIRYPIRRTHLAVVLWCAESGRGDELASMERFVYKLAETLGAGNESLFIPADQVTGWAWIAISPDAAVTAVERVRAISEAEPDAPWVAIGSPLPDLAGFRHSHRQARDARTVATFSGAPRHRATAAGDAGLAVVSLLGSNPAAAADWVGEVLGPLASDTANDHRLRETLRVFLAAGSSYTGAADVLHLHHNSVKYRVRRAVGRRGRSITADRLDVEVALTLCHWLGTAVLG